MQGKIQAMWIIPKWDALYTLPWRHEMISMRTGAIHHFCNNNSIRRVYSLYVHTKYYIKYSFRCIFIVLRYPQAYKCNFTKHYHAFNLYLCVIITTFVFTLCFQSWQEKEAGKVVMYTTTMGIVRETYHRCLKVKQILRTHLVKFEEKDVFMSRELQKEIRERMKTDEIVVPQVFVEGILIGVSIFLYVLEANFSIKYSLKINKTENKVSKWPTTFWSGSVVR